MNIQELIEKIESLDKLYGEKFYVTLDDVLDLVKQLDEPETGHADEAPRYVKNILARLRELPLHDREVWLKAIMGEFERDFSHAKWREGYEQGKFEGAWVGNQLKDADKIRQELNKPVIPQFVANYIEQTKNEDYHLLGAMTEIRSHKNKEIDDWFYTDDNMELFARAWLDGYEEVEEENRYYVRLKTVDENYNYLNYINHLDAWCLTEIKTDKKFRTTHTRKQLEDAGFGEVFNSPLFEVEEVER